MAKTVKIGPYSAYAIAVAAGYQGTEQEWLASLVGPQGAQGASVTGAQIDENGHLILTVHDPKTSTDTTIDAGSIDTTGAVQNVLAQIQKAGQDAVASVAQSVEQAAGSASAAAASAEEAANSAAQAQSFAESAAASKESAAESAEIVSANAGNLQTVVDNLDAIKDAPAAAQAAAQSAAEAAQSAQQALGFRTFFSAVSPDENGDLDPSRPMTTVAARASWTVKSKGDRIQSVQVNGPGGQSLVAGVFDGSKTFYPSPSTGSVYIELPVKVFESADRNPIAYSERYPESTFSQLSSNAEGFSALNNRDWPTSRAFAKNPNFGADVEKAKQYFTENPLEFWYEPADISQATGLYIPIQAQGHEYRCQCLPITEALGVGDNVQSNVPSGCDKIKIFNGSEDWKLTSPGDSQQRFGLAGNVPNFAYSGFYTNYLPKGSPPDNLQNSPYINMYRSGFIDANIPGIDSLEEWKSYLAKKNLVLYYTSTAYTEQSDVPVSFETHASGAVYAHDAIKLVAVPYTEADAGHTPGAYDVSSQDGTTVQVSLKAMQDGGDAATLDGHTWADIQKLISDAVSSAVALSQ